MFLYILSKPYVVYWKVEGDLTNFSRQNRFSFRWLIVTNIFIVGVTVDLDVWKKSFKIIMSTLPLFFIIIGLFVETKQISIKDVENTLIV